VTILPNKDINSEFTYDNNDLTANTNNQIEVFSDLVPSTGTTGDITIGGNDNNDNNDNVIIDGLVGVNFVVINGLSYTEKSITKDGYEEFYIDVRGVRYYGYDTIIFDKLQKNEYESVDMTLYDPYTKTEIHKTNSAFTKLINSCRFTINPDETLRMYDGVTTESLANSIRDRLNNDEDLKIYDYRFDGYPIKVTDTPKIKQVGYYNWNYYLNVTSDLLNDGDGTSPFATQSFVQQVITELDFSDIQNAITNIQQSIPVRLSDLLNDGDGISPFATQARLSDLNTTFAE
jgi:hypothetical protein